MKYEAPVAVAELLTGLAPKEVGEMKKAAAAVNKLLESDVGSANWFRNLDWVRGIAHDSSSVYFEAGTRAWSDKPDMDAEPPSLGEKLKIIQGKKFSNEETEALSTLVKTFEAYKAKVNYYRSLRMTKVRAFGIAMGHLGYRAGSFCVKGFRRVLGRGNS